MLALLKFLIWQKAVAATHIIAMKLYWRHLNLADGQKIVKPPTTKYTAYTVFATADKRITLH